MLYMPFLSGSNTLPVKTVLLLNVLKNKKKIEKIKLVVYHFGTRNLGAGSKSQLGGKHKKTSNGIRETNN